MTIWNDFQGGGVRESYYRAGSVRTRVLEAGDGGQPLFLLHGTTGHAEAFCRNIVPLAKERHVLAVDMLGHGYTDRSDEQYRLADFADHLLALADALGVEKVDLSGESLGAMVAATFAIRHPDRVGRILMGTGILARAPESGKADIDALLELTAKMDKEMTRDNIAARMRWLVANPEDMTDELIDVRYRIFSQPGMKDRINKTMVRVMHWLTGIAEEEYLEPGVMGRIACPTLLLWTTHNPLWTVEQAEAAATEIPDCRYEMLDSGHWPQFECAAENNELHRSFFSEA
jgi:2-hydroxy-6-oxonona-2,4-dienedioate hydrolase